MAISRIDIYLWPFSTNKWTPLFYIGFYDRVYLRYLHFAFQNNVASIPSSWLFTVFAFCMLHSEIIWPRFHALWLFTVFAFWILHSEIIWPRFHAFWLLLKLFGLDSMLFCYFRYLHSVFCILKLFGLDFMLVGYFQYLHSVLIILLTITRRIGTR